MMWRSLLAAVLVLPSLAYVGALMYSQAPAPDRRPAVVLPTDADASARPSVLPRPTIKPHPEPPPVRDEDRDDRDDRDDEVDDDDDDIAVIRPAPQDPDDDDDGDDGGDDDSDDD